MNINSIYNYHSLIFAGLWLFIVYIFQRSRYKLLIKNGKCTESDVKLFRKRMSYLIVVPLFVLQIFHILSQPYIESGLSTINNPWEMASCITYLLWGSYVFYLLWFRNAALYFSKYAQVFRLPENPFLLKMEFTILFFAFILVIIVQIVFL